MIKFSICEKEKPPPYECKLDCSLKIVDGNLRLYCKSVGADGVPKAILGITDIGGHLIRYEGIPKEFGFDTDELGRIK